MIHTSCLVSPDAVIQQHVVHSLAFVGCFLLHTISFYVPNNIQHALPSPFETVAKIQRGSISRRADFARFALQEFPIFSNALPSLGLGGIF